MLKRKRGLKKLIKAAGKAELEIPDLKIDWGDNNLFGIYVAEDNLNFSKSGLIFRCCPGPRKIVISGDLNNLYIAAHYRLLKRNREYRELFSNRVKPFVEEAERINPKKVEHEEVNPHQQ